MVRRRSTVRFRKGARRLEPFFDSEPVTLLGGLTAEGTGQRFGYLREPCPSAGSRGLWVPSGGGQWAPWGALWGGRSSFGPVQGGVLGSGQPENPWSRCPGLK